jgi:serine/threonine-protein kinase HipA
VARMDLLHLLIDGTHAGVVRRDRGVVRLAYDDDYANATSATALSTSLPFFVQEHAGDAIGAFLDGLLPDSDAVRARWARQFQTTTQPFDLLAQVGEDCAGAAQFVREDRLDDLDPGGIEWLTIDDLEAWIASLRIDQTAWLPDTDRGQFSLAGAQRKFALLRDSDRWGRPYGAVPTTHIVKPAIDGFTHHEVNEHLSLATARHLGLRAANSEILTVGSERVVVVERYDRVRVGAGWRRVHQEDMCQAMGIPPASKYENQDGLSAKAIAGLLRSTIDADAEAAVASFADALAFNWLIGGTDAHAKNYSLLLAGRQTRFAPLYDVASALPYTTATPTRPRPGELDAARLKLAMSVNGHCLIREIRVRDWHHLGEDLGIGGDYYVTRIADLAERIPTAVDKAVNDPAIATLASDMPALFATKVPNHAALCAQTLKGRAPLGRRR